VTRRAGESCSPITRNPSPSSGPSRWREWSARGWRREP
jgi:hypothetical protein